MLQSPFLFLSTERHLVPQNLCKVANQCFVRHQIVFLKSLKSKIIYVDALLIYLKIHRQIIINTRKQCYKKLYTARL
jgi:hypothetical protein